MGLLLATVLPGLEYVLKNEIRVKIADAEFQSIERGKVYFSSGLFIEQLTVLRTADNLYKLIHRFRVGPHKIHLAGIEHEISALDLSSVTLLQRGLISCKVNASRAGKHTYSRFDAAEAAARGIVKCDSRLRHSLEGMHELEFRLDIHDDEAVFALRLTDSSYRYRTEQRRFALAALRPTVAHALVWLSNPAATDIFVDPCCGSGTILSERLAYPYCHIEGGDLNKEAVEVSIENIGYQDHVKIRHWDACRLPIDSGYADKMVTNLPFGRQIIAEGNIEGLYCGIFKEMKRVLKINGQVYCLTDSEAALLTAAGRIGFSVTKVMTLSLKGLHPSLFLLK